MLRDFCGLAIRVIGSFLCLFDLEDYTKPVILGCNTDGSYLAALIWTSPVTVLETSTKGI
jgi:hypothetical protein